MVESNRMPPKKGKKRNHRLPQERTRRMCLVTSSTVFVMAWLWRRMQSSVPHGAFGYIAIAQEYQGAILSGSHRLSTVQRVLLQLVELWLMKYL